jgi:hypothetical protein
MFTFFQARHKDVWFKDNDVGGAKNVGTVQNTWTSKQVSFRQNRVLLRTTHAVAELPTRELGSNQQHH